MNSVWYACLILHRSLTPLSLRSYPLLKNKYNRGIVKACSTVRAAEARAMMEQRNLLRGTACTAKHGSIGISLCEYEKFDIAFGPFDWALRNAARSPTDFL